METVTLKSGRQAVIRQIRPDDGPRLELGYRSLSPQSQYRRFLGSKPRLTDADVRYLTDVDGKDHFALVATTAAAPDWIIAVARFVRFADDPEAAEFAIVVGDPYQGDGLGGEMLDRLARAATARGIRRFRATVLAENIAAHKLTRRLANRLSPTAAPARPASRERHLGTVDEVEVELAA